jgi:hypothetical protein
VPQRVGNRGVNNPQPKDDKVHTVPLEALKNIDRMQQCPPGLRLQWRRPRRSGPALAVLLLHAVLLVLWLSGVATRSDESAPVGHRPPMVVRNVVLVSVPRADASAPKVTAAVQQQRRRLPPAPVVSRPPSDATLSTAPSSLPATVPEPPVSVVTPTEAAASAPLNLALPRIAGPAAMQGRGALLESQGSARQLALNDPRSNQRADPTQQLLKAVAAAGKGDCLKGDYAGAGMGLLSAPFLAYAAAAGHCKPQR